MFAISIDPGLSATGYVIWKNGKPFSWKAIYPKGADLQAKLTFLSNQLKELFEAYCRGGAARIAIEKFEPGFHPKKNTSGVLAALGAMTKCAAVQGLIFGVATGFTEDVRLVSKGRVSKDETALRWELMGLGKKPVEHVLDALEIGIASGFDRRGN